MNADRKSLLEMRLKAKSALAKPGVPEAVRAKYREALDRVEITLSMQDAAMRRAVRDLEAND